MLWLRQYLKNIYLRDWSEKKYSEEYKKPTQKIQYKIKNLEAELVLGSKTVFSEEPMSHWQSIEWGRGKSGAVYGDWGAAVEGKDESFESWPLLLQVRS